MMFFTKMPASVINHFNEMMTTVLLTKDEKVKENTLESIKKYLNEHGALKKYANQENLAQIQILLEKRNSLSPPHIGAQLPKRE